MALALLLLLPALGARDLWAPDEPRYAQIAEEMRQAPRGVVDWVVLRLNGTVYTQKPPLYFWTAATLGAFGGRVDEAAARLPSALAGIAAVALTGVLGGAVLGSRRAGWIAATGLLTTPRFVYQARRAQLDVLLCAFELGALLAYWRLDTGMVRGERPSRGTIALLHGAVGLAILTKGPVGALPWLVIGVHRASEGRLRSLGALFPAWGVALAVAPALLWLGAAVALTPAGWFDQAIVDNLVARFFAGTDHVRPFWYYAVHLPLDALPWTPLVVVGGVIAARRAGEAANAGPDRRAARLLLAWAGVFAVFFSLSAGKRGLYMLPLLPGLAMLAAVPVEAWLRTGRTSRGGPLTAALLLAAVAAAGLWLALGAPGWTGRARADALPAALGWTVFAIGGLGAAAVLAVRARAGWPGALLAVALSVAALEGVGIHVAFPALEAEKSPRPIARAAAEASSTRERVGVFRHATFAGGLAYYADRPVVVLETPADVADFVDTGGRLVVVRERDRSALAPAAGRRVLAAARSGRRRLLLIEVSATGSSDAARGPDDMDADQPMRGPDDMDADGPMRRPDDIDDDRPVRGPSGRRDVRDAAPRA